MLLRRCPYASAHVPCVPRATSNRRSRCDTDARGSVRIKHSKPEPVTARNWQPAVHVRGKLVGSKARAIHGWHERALARQRTHRCTHATLPLMVRVAAEWPCKRQRQRPRAFAHLTYRGHTHSPRTRVVRKTPARAIAITDRRARLQVARPRVERLLAPPRTALDALVARASEALPRESPRSRRCRPAVGPAPRAALSAALLISARVVSRCVPRRPLRAGRARPPPPRLRPAMRGRST